MGGGWGGKSMSSPASWSGTTSSASAASRTWATPRGPFSNTFDSPGAGTRTFWSPPAQHGASRFKDDGVLANLCSDGRSSSLLNPGRSQGPRPSRGSG